jgi:excisionase family DNA binding protein
VKRQPVQPTPAVVPQLLTLEQVKARLGLSYHKIRTLYWNEDLSMMRLGEGMVRISETSIEQWLEDHGEIVMRMKKEPYPGTAVERAKRSWPSATSRRPQEAKKTQTAPAPAEVSQLLTYKDLMRILRVSKNKAYQIIHSGEIAIVHVGEHIRIRPEALAKWIAEHEDVW